MSIFWICYWYLITLLIYAGAPTPLQLFVLMPVLHCSITRLFLNLMILIVLFLDGKPANWSRWNVPRLQIQTFGQMDPPFVRMCQCPPHLSLTLPDHAILLWPNNMQICCSAIDHPFLPLLTLMLLCHSPQPNSWVSLSKRPVTPLWGTPFFVSFSKPPLIYFTTKIRP